MKKIFTLLAFIVLTFNSFGQTIPDGFVLKKVIQARDLVVGSPSSILFNESLSHMVISYDAKPTFLAVYETEKWERVNMIEIKEHLYLGQSYMDCENNELLYGDYGNNNPQFYTINILSDYASKTPKKDVPTQKCGYAFQGETKLREQIFNVKDTFYVVVNFPKKTVQVFGKK